MGLDVNSEGVSELFQSLECCRPDLKPRVGNPGLKFANAFGVVPQVLFVQTQIERKNEQANSQ